MVVNLICPVWASAVVDMYYADQTDEIERILAELGELRAKSLSDENEYTRNGDDMEYRINELEAELTDLGVEVLTQDEVAELMGQSENARVTVPDTTNTVKWYSVNVRQLYNGDPYTVKKVYAQGLNGTSTLQATTYSYARKAEFRDADEKAIFTVQFPTPSTFWEIG